MKFCDKILNLRKQNEMSQEQLAEKLNVSRQAVSRWEMGTAQPDASNVLQLSKIFNVTADYLLNDEYESDKDVPAVKQTENQIKEQTKIQIGFIVTVGISIMVLIGQCIFYYSFKNTSLTLLGTILTIAIIIGFEYVYRSSNVKSEYAKKYYTRFYIAEFWIGTYFPINILAEVIALIYPRAYNVIIFQALTLLMYIIISVVATKTISKKLK